MTRIGIVDCGISNVGSVRNAFRMFDKDAFLIHKPAELADCSHIVLPGDGSFPEGMDRLAKTGLDEAVIISAAAGKPILGICLGMQLFADEGEEFGLHQGLGLVRGRITRMNVESLPLPNVGWNDVSLRAASRLVGNLGDKAAFYFMQSFAYDDAAADYVVAICDYGGDRVAAIESGNVFGVQFHPEKSQRAGLQILKNFAETE